MQIILYGELEPDYPYHVDLEKKPANYSNGSGRQIEWLTDKQFERASKKFEKYMAKQRKKLKKTNERT